MFSIPSNSLSTFSCSSFSSLIIDSTSSIGIGFGFLICLLLHSENITILVPGQVQEMQIEITYK